MYSPGLTNPQNTKVQQSQSSFISLKRQRKEKSAETSWGGRLSKNLRDQGLFPKCPQRCSVPGVDSDTCRYSPHTEARAGYKRQDHSHITHSRNNTQEQETLLKGEKNQPSCNRAGEEQLSELERRLQLPALFSIK